MKFVNLVIERKPSYDPDYPHELVGLVQLSGNRGKMEIRLSNDTISKILAIARPDAAMQAENNAQTVTTVLLNACNEKPLIDKVSEIEELF